MTHLIIRKIVILSFVLFLGVYQTAAAAPLVQEESIIWPVLERLIVIAGAALLINVWQKWRERKKGQ